MHRMTLYLLFSSIPYIIMATGGLQTQPKTLSIINVVCYNSSLEGFRLNATVVKATVVSQWIDCIMECATELCCRSINFKKTFKNESNCEMLHDVVHNTSSNLLETNSFYHHVHLVNPQKIHNVSCLTQKYRDKNLQGVPTMRSPVTYKSCKDALNQNSSLPNGRYELQLDEQSQIYEVYCHMKKLDVQECDGGGWTLIMKTNENTQTFKYDSHLWNNNETLNAAAGAQFGHFADAETKLASYTNTPFTKICLGMKDPTTRTTKWIGIAYQASSMHSVIADGAFKSLNFTTQKWQSLIGGSLLPVDCPIQGFNVPSKIFPTQKRVRIGYLAHKSCQQQEGLIGFGVNLDGFIWSSGYNYPSRDGNGNKQIRSIAYIYVR